jgi:predicted exporter
LRGAPELTRVDAGVVDATRDFGWLADRQLLLLGDGALDEAFRRFRPGGLKAAVASRRELLGVPSPAIAELVQQDPAGLYDLLRDALGGPQAGLNIGVSQDGYVTSDGRRRLVIAYPKRPPYDAAFSRALDARLRNIHATIRETATDPPEDALEARPPLRVEFAGGHRIAVETEACVRSESIMNTIGSLALILPLLYIVFRSPWLVAVGALPSALSLIVVLGLLGVSGATLSAPATGSAAMLFGLGVDGVVLLYVAHRRNLADGLEPAQAVAETSGPASSMLLGMFTTAATFYGLMFVDFPSLQELGRLIGHSMVICGVLTLIMVPALLPRRAPQRAVRALLMPALADWIRKYRRGVIAVSVALTLGLGLAATRLRINPTLERLRSVTAAARLEEQIGSAFGLPRDVYIALASGPELEPLLRTNEALVRRLSTEVTDLRIQAPTRLLPSAATQAGTADRIRQSGLSPATVGAALDRAAVEAGFKPEAFSPFISRLPRVLDPAHRLAYDDYLAHGLGDVIGRFIARDSDHRDQWILATYLFPSSTGDIPKIQALVDAVDPGQTLTGLQLVNGELAARFLPQFLKGLSIGTAIVVLLIVVAFRDWRLSIFALLPTAIGLIWTAGVLALAGVELDLFAVFAVVTFVGIGVDYGIHLVHRYKELGQARRAVAELAPVILIAAAITLLGYGTLVYSSYPPLRSIGVVSAVSVVALAVASVLVLPALIMEDQRA